MDLLDTTTVAISINGLDVMALKKLSLVSHALAQKIGGSAGREQETLANTLDSLIRKIELSAAVAA